MGFVADANSRHGGFGRNTKTDKIESKATAIAPDDPIDIKDDDLLAAMGKMRSSGKAPPKRPTPRQKSIVAALVAAHGESEAGFVAMSKDRKRNPMQHTVGELKKLIESVNYWKGKTGVDFRVPVKGLW